MQANWTRVESQRGHSLLHRRKRCGPLVIAYAKIRGKGKLVFRFSGSERAALARHLNSFPIPYWKIGNKLSNKTKDFENEVWKNATKDLEDGVRNEITGRFLFHDAGTTPRTI
jgi:hypothetical protein